MSLRPGNDWLIYGTHSADSYPNPIKIDVTTDDGKFDMEFDQTGPIIVYLHRERSAVMALELPRGGDKGGLFNPRQRLGLSGSLD